MHMLDILFTSMRFNTLHMPNYNLLKKTIRVGLSIIDFESLIPNIILLYDCQQNLHSLDQAAYASSVQKFIVTCSCLPNLAN